MNICDNRHMDRSPMEAAASVVSIGLMSVLGAAAFWILMRFGVWVLEKLFPVSF
jgi:hypothetical protein